MKKVIFFTFLLILFSALGWFFFWQTTYRSPFAGVQALEAIPQNTAIILEFEDYFLMRHALAKMPYAEDLAGAFFVKKMSEDFDGIRLMFAKNKNHRQLLLDSRITASLHLSGQADVDFLYVIKDQSAVFELPKLLTVFPYRQSESGGATVYQLDLGKGKKYTIARYKDLVVLSKHAYLVENSLRQLQQPQTNLLKNDLLNFSQKVKLDENQVNVYILLENFVTLAQPFLKKEMHANLDFLSANISSAQCQLSFEKEGIKMETQIKSKNGNVLLQELFPFSQKSSEESNFKNHPLQNILPKNTAYFLSSNWKAFETSENSKNSTSEIFDKFFKPWIGQEWGIGRVEIFTRKMAAEKFVVYQMQDKDFQFAQHYLQQLGDSLGLLKSWDYQTYPMRRLAIDELPLPYANCLGITLKNPCYTFIEGYVVFAGAARILENWVDNYLTGENLARRESYLRMKNKTEKTAPLEFYWNNLTASKLLRSVLQSKETDALAQVEIWENFPALGFNFFAHQDDELKGEGFLFYQKENARKTVVKWRAPLQAAARTAPHCIFNSEKAAYEILIQDENHRLYLFNMDGEELWNKPLNEPILSKIYAADFSESSSSYFLFNTASHIYLLDAKGNEQHNFPLALASPATNGLLLANYGERNLGIYVACANERLYGFDQNGIPFSGWQAVEGAGTVRQPLKHFQTNDKDYVVALNEVGDVFAFGIDGFPTMEATNVTITNAAPLCFQLAKNESRMVVADKNGKPVVLDLDGQNLNLTQNGISKNPISSYAAADFAGNNFVDYAALVNNELQIFYHHQDEFAPYGQFRFTNRQDEIFSVKSKSMGKSMLGSVDKKRGQVFLLDKKAQLHPDFPLAGTTAFELVNLFSEEDWAVVVANGENLVVYGR